MYIPRHFRIDDRDRQLQFVEANAFGQLVSQHEGRLFSTHLPFMLSHDRTRLLGHLARQNPQLIDLEGQEVMVTFQGPHDYISPSWYVSPGVPTWNYQAVHVYGEVQVFNDPARLRSIVDELTWRYESAFENPWEPDYRESMLGAISGIEISIKEIQCKFKLSQNRSAADRDQVIANLRELGSVDMANAMIEDGAG